MTRVSGNGLWRVSTRPISFLLVSVLSAMGVCGADCTTATVGQPFSTCFDIYTNAGLTSMQFAADNPGLDCSTLQIGQRVCISPGTLPSNAPSPSPDGTCAEYTTVSGDFCAAIAARFDITVAQIEAFNVNTFHWTGCSGLQVGFTMCVSAGNPPPIPVIPGLQCGPQSEKNATCPPNVCCSAFGFCGLTNDFCTTQQPNPCLSNCFTPTLPSCSTSRPMRKIAYYAGFGNRRSCNINIAPGDIDWSPYTHVHFAFATITQGLQIQLEDADVPLLKQLVAQKASHPQLKIIIALGGWDFSELQPTRDLFSLMISSSANRNTFISSAVSFLSQFGLDGIDIDFEYPSAIERAAPQTDTPNLTAFFKDLRAALPTQIVSCATPAGFWFLQGFEINKIADSVTYLNMMSYDYHGQWDTNITGQAPVTDPHTSILDMRDSALLYVRAGIDLSIVNLGLAFYARTYQLADASCKGYNCTMVGGGAAGPCSVTPGILTQFEVEDLLNSGAVPTLDTPSETHWFDFQGSLVTFDQSDTLATKLTFAEMSCFGGTFIWSLDQSTAGLVDGSGDGSSGGGQFSAVTWNPNPFPSPGAKSATFIQIPGPAVLTTASVASDSTQTVTDTVVIQPVTSTRVQFSSKSGGIIETFTSTTVIPASTATVTRTVDLGSTVIATTTVIKTATSTVIPVPSATTSITFDGLIITLDPGGTPINSMVPTFISQPSAITPNWTLGILPPTGASVVTFTAPLTSRATYSTTVPVPSKSDSPPSTVSGPAGDHSRCDQSRNIWELVFGGIINGCPPADVGIRGGLTPIPIPPPGWTGGWDNPFPLPTGPPGPDDPTATGTKTSTDSSSTTTSETSTSSCALQTPVYDLPDDPENSDFDNLGTDPNIRRRYEAVPLTVHGVEHNDDKIQELVNITLHARASARHIAVNRCGIRVSSPSAVSLGAAKYYRIDPSSRTTTQLVGVTVSGRPSTLAQGMITPQEHVFELGYIDKFFSASPLMTQSCTWVQANIIDFPLPSGQTLGDALVQAIDNVNNMVWVDNPMNQAKSNVVNQNRGSPQNPPQSQSTSRLTSFAMASQITKVEIFVRNFAALGQYFAETAPIFKATALAVQNLLSEVTPDSVPDANNSIPSIFNLWLSNLVATYPSGCVDRANNVFNFYQDKMNTIATSTGQTIPVCFPVASTNRNSWQPSGFNARDLIPNAPTSARCNVPGVVGDIGYTSGTNTDKKVFEKVIIMGSGNTDYYAMGLQSNHAFRMLAIDLGPQLQTPACNGVSALNILTQGGAPANVAFQCATPGTQEADFNFVRNGQPLGCVASVVGHAGGTTTTLICATSQGNAMACANAAFQSGANFPVQMRFFPS